MIISALLMSFPALMAFAAATDLFTMRIPNKLSLALVAGFIAVGLSTGLPWSAFLMHGAAGILVLAVGFGLFAFGWIGGGDAKLAAATALWFGFQPLMNYLLLSSLAGGALTLALLSFRGVPLPAFALGWDWLVRLHDRKTGVPYGIALAGAALVIYPESPVWTGVFGL